MGSANVSVQTHRYCTVWQGCPHLRIPSIHFQIYPPSNSVIHFTNYLHPSSVPFIHSSLHPFSIQLSLTHLVIHPFIWLYIYCLPIKPRSQPCSYLSISPYPTIYPPIHSCSHTLIFVSIYLYLIIYPLVIYPPCLPPEQTHLTPLVSSHVFIYRPTVSTLGSIKLLSFVLTFLYKGIDHSWRCYISRSSKPPLRVTLF